MGMSKILMRIQTRDLNTKAKKSPAVPNHSHRNNKFSRQLEGSTLYQGVLAVLVELSIAGEFDVFQVAVRQFPNLRFIIDKKDTKRGCGGVGVLLGFAPFNEGLLKSGG
ncbi:hypothetical protein N9B94_02805 [Verrucomicrobia bacterium]|nr:hypothetical protein [Verrucomicrobiota bacterium]